MFADRFTSEYFIKTEARGRSVEEFKQRPEWPDNAITDRAKYLLSAILINRSTTDAEWP